MNPELFYILFLILFGIFIFTLIVMGIFLLYKGGKNRMVNIILGGISFVSLPIGLIGYFIFQLDPLYLEFIIVSSFVLTVVFTNKTFYKNRGFKSKLVLFTVLVLGSIQIGFFFIAKYGIWTTFLYYLRVSLDFPYTFLVFNWLSYSAYSAYKLVKFKLIDPWIKVRYKMLTIFSFIFSFHSLPEFFHPLGTLWGDPNNFLSLASFGTTAILVVIFSLGFSIAWIMPKGLKKRINRNYQPIEDKDFPLSLNVKNNQAFLQGFLT
ncbi:MAG: hypothetical protein ACFE96_18085, partial [Candidatus Hermodarchaeota archaeon]